MGDSAVARYAGSTALIDRNPGACAPGFMLPPASRARFAQRSELKLESELDRARAADLIKRIESAIGAT